MIRYTTAALLGFVLLAGYYTVMALIGGMSPPAAGEERTRYAYWYRVLQLLAANIERAAEHRFGADYAATAHVERTASRTAIAGPSGDGEAVVETVTERTDVVAESAK